MDHNALNLFLHLSRSLHFARTSRECHVSPSTLSRVIQRLEEEVGERLFDRDNRSVALTYAGELFRAHASEQLARWEAFQADLRPDPASLTGEISLYCSVTACYSILPDLLGRFREAHPNIKIKLETGDAALALPKVADGDVDITVAALPERLPDGIDAKVVVHTPLVFIAPTGTSDLAAAVTEDVDLAATPMIISDTGLAREWTEKWFDEKGIRPTIYASVAGNEAIIVLVALGYGIGVVPRLVLEKSLMRGELRVLDLQPPLPSFHVGVCVRRKRMSSPLIHAFWQAMS